MFSAPGQVAVNPGQIALTRTFVCASSVASVLVRAFSAASPTVKAETPSSLAVFAAAAGSREAITTWTPSSAS